MSEKSKKYSNEKDKDKDNESKNQPTEEQRKQIKRKLVKLEKDGNLTKENIRKLKLKYPNVDFEKEWSDVKNEEKELKIKLFNIADNLLKHYYKDRSLTNLFANIKKYKNKYDLDSSDVDKLVSNIAKKVSVLNYSKDKSNKFNEKKGEKRERVKNESTKTAKALGISNDDDNKNKKDKEKDKDREMKIDKIVSVYYDNIDTYNLAGVLSKLYNGIPLQLIGSKFNQNFSFIDSIHPWYVILYAHKIKFIENRTININISKIIEKAIKKNLNLDTYEEHEFFNDLITDPDDFGEDYDPLDDLRQKAEIQKDNCYFLSCVRTGKLYSQDFKKRVQKLSKRRSNMYDEIELNQESNEVTLVREWLAAISARTTNIIISDLSSNENFRNSGILESIDQLLYEKKVKNLHHHPFRSAVPKRKLIAVSTISIYTPPQSLQNKIEPIEFEDTYNRTISLNTEDGIVYKNVDLVSANNIIVFVINRRSFGSFEDENDADILEEELISDYDYHTIPSRYGLQRPIINNFPLNVRETIAISKKRKVFVLRGVIVARTLTTNKSYNLNKGDRESDLFESNSNSNDIQSFIGLNGFIVEQLNNNYEYKYYCYDPLAPLFPIAHPNGQGYFIDKPITEIPRNLTPQELTVGNKISFYDTASTAGTVFIFEKSGN